MIRHPVSKSEFGRPIYMNFKSVVCPPQLAGRVRYKDIGYAVSELVDIGFK